MEEEIQKINFPKNFYWGAAASAHQVEGDNHNDWTEWERQSLKLKIKSAELKIWPDYILKNYPNPLQEENYISGRACDHYNRFREDFDIAKSIGHTAHRFSIEWSRIEPEEGKFSEKEIEHYREVIKALRKREMEPFVTLWHYTLPLWLRNKGGAENKIFPNYFSSFVEKIHYEFKDDVRFWITFNEPSLWAAQAYLTGIWPPQKKNILSTVRVFFNLIRSHKEAYDKIKSVQPEAIVGISENFEWQEPSFIRPLVHYFRNLFFLDRIRRHLDFIGINYYKAVNFFKLAIFLSPNDQHCNSLVYRGNALSDVGWLVYPDGLYKLLIKVWRRYKLPIFISENGIADTRDIYRPLFIRSHIDGVKEALKDGADIRGYFYFSLLDNFEWEKGFWPRFGLVEIDYKTMQRRLRQSAFEYKRIIEDSKDN